MGVPRSDRLGRSRVRGRGLCYKLVVVARHMLMVYLLVFVVTGAR